MLKLLLISCILFVNTTVFADSLRVSNQGDHPYRHVGRDLNSGSDTPADEECATYESSTGGFEWQTCGAGSGDSVTVNGSATSDVDFTDGGIGWTLDTAPSPDTITGALRTITSANLLTAVTDETGTGQAVFNTSPTMTSPTVVTSINLPAAAVDAITEITSSLKTGADGQLVTGTAGASGRCAEWNADGDLVEAASAAACGSGGSGDSVQVNSTASTDANFVDAGIGFTLNTAPAVDEISASLRTISSSALLAAVQDETGTGQAVFNTSPTMTGPTVQTSFVYEQSGGTDVMTGNTVGVAFQLRSYLPFGATPSIDGQGLLAIDTTDDQLRYYGNKIRTIPYYENKCVTIENVKDTDDNLPIGMWPYAVEIRRIYCSYVGTGSTPATFTLEDGSGNVMAIAGGNPTCVAHGTNSTAANTTTGFSLAAGEILRFDVSNTPVPTTDTYTICVDYEVSQQ